MEIFIPDRFVVPVKYNILEDLYRNEGVKDNQLEGIQEFCYAMIDDSVDYIKGISNEISLEQLLAIHLVGFSAIWKFHLNIECFQDLKNKLKKDYQLEDVLNVHKNKMEGLFKKHLQLANCKDTGKIMNDEDFQKIKIEVEEKVNSKMKELRSFTEEFSYWQIRELHGNIFKYLFQKDLKIIPCFKEAIKNLNVQDLENNHFKKVVDLFDKHANMTTCNRYEEKKIDNINYSRVKNLYNHIDNEFAEKEIEFKLY